VNAVALKLPKVDSGVVVVAGAVVGVALLGVWLASRNRGGQGGGGFLENFSRGTVGSVGDVVIGAAKGAGDVIGGAVQDVGEMFGIPRTSASECARAKAEGSKWRAFVHCPAGEFTRWIFSDESSAGAPRAVTPPADRSPAQVVAPAVSSPCLCIVAPCPCDAWIAPPSEIAPYFGA
jgi:hypothetical protein